MFVMSLVNSIKLMRDHFRKSPIPDVALAFKEYQKTREFSNMKKDWKMSVAAYVNTLLGVSEAVKDYLDDYSDRYLTPKLMTQNIFSLVKIIADADGLAN